MFIIASLSNSLHVFSHVLIHKGRNKTHNHIKKVEFNWNLNSTFEGEYFIVFLSHPTSAGFPPSDVLQRNHTVYVPRSLHPSCGVRRG